MAKVKQEFIFTLSDNSKRSIIVVGRDAWALDNLIKAGKKGCTPIDNPAPRWSGYIHKLRKNYGIDIETIDEAHGGPYAGTHARYVLKSNVQPAAESEAA